MYNLGGTDLSLFDFIPVVQASSDIALSGFLDMPSRLGKTFHDWSSEDGIEPYVSASDIAVGGYAGRDLILNGVITGQDLYDCNSKLSDVYALIDGFIGTVPLITDYGTYQVYVNAPVVGEYLPTGGNIKGIKVTIPFREPYPVITGTVPTEESDEFGIDGVSFASLGGAFLELKGDRLNRTAPKKIDVTVFGKEAYQPTKRGPTILDLKLGIKTNTYSEMHDKVYGLMAILAGPGLRSLTVNNDKLRSFFVKDGFTVSQIHVYTEPCFCVIDCKLTESGAIDPFQRLIDSLGDIVKDNDGNTIKILI